MAASEPVAVPLNRVEIRRQQDRGPATARQRRVAAADKLQTGVQAGLVKIGLRTQHDRVGNRAKSGVRTEQWWPDEAANSGSVVGQVAAARRGTASGRRGITSGRRLGGAEQRRQVAATRRGISSRRCGIISGRRQVAATRCSGISSGPQAAR